jgi:hypothetical protein
MPSHAAPASKRPTRVRVLWALVSVLVVLAGAFAAVLETRTSSSSTVTAIPKVVRTLPAEPGAITSATPVPLATTGASPAADLNTDFAQLQAAIGAPIGIVVTSLGSAGVAPIVLGDWRNGPAWSTSKVPVSIAALREDSSLDLLAAVSSAITVSDNGAAEAVWARLGEPHSAAAKVETVLREAGDSTVVEAERVRPGFTAFGQTQWPLNEQARSMGFAACDPRNEKVLSLMGQVSSDQSWGLGTLTGVRFEGGWGPSPSGAYLVRQIGIIGSADAMSAVAIAVDPASGSFGEGAADLTTIAQWLSDRSAQLPAGSCG